ncbi:MAG: hypothetical protein M0C28_48395 [Candidatus Moduliflexus flocculans]|nr:hypothetical protein [Candidatus Moduliflexus flocculans]
MPKLQHQRGQRVYAFRWGWPPDQVLVIDEDIGRGGQPAAQRVGFQRLRRMIAEGRVGLVLIDNLARVSQSATEVGTFLDLCGRAGTLVVVDGTVLDRPASSDDIQERLYHLVCPVLRGRHALHNGTRRWAPFA